MTKELQGQGQEMKHKMRKESRMPTSEEIDALIKEEDEALEQKYQRLLKKRQELDARIAETVKALGEQKMMNHILEGIKSDLEKQG